MKKIVLALDGAGVIPHALDFACYLGRLTHSQITGVVLENPVAGEGLVLEDSHGTSFANQSMDKKSEKNSLTIKDIDEYIPLFKDAFEKRSVKCNFRLINGNPAREIVNESRYADLLVVGAETSFNSRFEAVPTPFVYELLKDAECPVIVAPERFEGIDELVFTYNASKSSMFAIKQFCYLFPQLKDKKVSVIRVDEEGLSAAGENDKFKGWISNHYSSVDFEILKGDTETELFASLFKKKNVFIVMGAYGRSTLSLFFKHSRADLLIKTTTQAMFIAHS